MSGLLAVAALIVVVQLLVGRIGEIQASRERAALDSCRVLTKLLYATANPGAARAIYEVVSPAGGLVGYLKLPQPRAQTSRQARVGVQTFLRRTGLANCEAYARSVRTGENTKGG